MRRWSWIAGASAVAAAIAVGYVLVRPTTPPRPAPNVPRRPALEQGDGLAAQVVRAAVAAVEREDDALSWYRLGLAYAAHDAPELAEQCLRRSIELDGRRAPARYHLALVHVYAGELDAAIESMRQSLALEPGYAPGHARLAGWLLERNEPDAAAAAYAEALRLDPSMAGARIGLARLALDRGDAEAALELTGDAALGPAWRDPQALQLRVGALRMLGRDAEADAVAAVPRGEPWSGPDPWRAEVDVYRTDAEAQVDRAKLLCLRGRFDEAQALLERLHAELPEHASVAVNLGVVHRLRGDLPGSARVLEAVLARDPASTMARYNLALALTMQHAADPVAGAAGLRTAAAHADAAIEGDPGHVASIVLRGDLHALVGEHLEAARRYDAALALEPGNPPIMLRRGQAELAAGEVDRAMATLRAVVEHMPESPVALAALAAAFDASGRTLEAQALRERAAALARAAGMTVGEAGR